MSKKHFLEMADHREVSYESEEDKYDESEKEDNGGKKPKGGTKTSIRSWTEKEDSLVTTLIGKLGKKWTAVGNEINRTGKQVDNDMTPLVQHPMPPPHPTPLHPTLTLPPHLTVHAPPHLS